MRKSLKEWKDNITMEDFKMMAYLLLGVKFFFFFVRLGERSLVADSQNRQQGLNFRGVTLMIHRVMPLTSQSVACSLFTLHFQIHTWNPGWADTKKVPGTRHYHLLENPKNWAKPN